MKKILLVILEIESASGICTLNIANKLINNGWDVHILSYTTDITINKKIKLHCIRPKFFLFMVSKCGKYDFLKQFFFNCYKLQIFLTKFMWPWNSPIFTLRLFFKIRKMFIKQKYDCIMPMYTQIDAIIAVNLLKTNNSFILIPCFLDSLSAGPVPRVLNKTTKIKKGIKWENAILDNYADGIIFMESSREHHLKYNSRSDFFNRVEFLDIPMLLPVKKNNNICSLKSNNKINKRIIDIIYVGSMPLSIRNPEYAFKLFSTVEQEIKVTIVGVPSSIIKQIEYYNIDITFIERVSHLKAIEYLKKADILLNIGNNIDGMVPSKIFEYMSYSKPILSISPSSKDPSIPYLRKYPNSCIIIETDDLEFNKKLLNRYLNEYNKETILSKDIIETFYKNTPDSFCDYINSFFNLEQKKVGD